MAPTLTDRRLDPRCVEAARRVMQATLRPGRHVQVVDLSPSGAQLQSERPLRPGSRVHIRLVFDDHAHCTAAMIVRCHVASIHPEQGVTYRAAVHFDERCAHSAISSYRPPTRSVQAHY